MHIKNWFHFAFESISRKWFVTLATILLCAASFFLIGLTGYLHDLTNYGYDNVNRTIREGIERTGTLIIDSNKFDKQHTEELRQLRDEIFNLPDIQSIGDYGLTSQTYEGTEELNEIQNREKKMFGQKEDLEVLHISSNLIQLCQTEFTESDIWKKYEGKENYCKIYLGHNFQNIPVGTVYECRITDDISLFYVVVGILAEDAKWLDESMIYSSEPMELSYTYSLNNMIVCEDKDVSSNIWIYTVQKENKPEDVKDKIRSIAKEYGIDMKFSSLENVFQKKESENQKITKYTDDFLWFVSITTIVIMICIQLSNIVSRSREYGILYANGASTKDLLWIMIIENTIKLFLGFCVSMGILKIIIQNTYKEMGEYWLSIGNKILYGYTIEKMAVAIVLLLFFISIVPVCYMSRLKPVALIGGEKG